MVEKFAVPIFNHLQLPNVELRDLPDSVTEGGGEGEGKKAALKFYEPYYVWVLLRPT